MNQHRWYWIMITLTYASSMETPHMNYNEAVKYCTQSRGILPRITYEDGYNKSLKIAKEQNILSFWVKIFNYTMGVFRFGGNSTYTPAVKHISGDCGFLDMDGEAYIRSRECDLKLSGYICSYTIHEGRCWEPNHIKINQSCYAVCSTGSAQDQRTWSAAQSLCLSNNMNLAIFQSEYQLEQMRKNIPTSPHKQNLYWIYLRRNITAFGKISGWITDEPKRSGDNTAVIAVKQGAQYLFKTVWQQESHQTICVDTTNEEMQAMTTGFIFHTSAFSTPEEKQGHHLEPTEKLNLLYLLILLPIFIMTLPVVHVLKKKCRSQRDLHQQNTPENRAFIEKRRVGHILLVGEISSGKSTLINSLICALGANKYCQWAKIGNYGAESSDSITRIIRSYELQKQPRFPALQGVKLDALEDDEVLTIWDTPGLPKKNRGRLKGFFKHLLCGKLPSEAAADHMNSRSIECKAKYCTMCNKCGCTVFRVAFDCVIFVHNIKSEAPVKVAEKLSTALRELNAEILKVLILTHIDQLEEDKDKRDSAMKKIKKELISKLGIEEQNCFCIKQYSSRTTLKKDEDIDKKLKEIKDFIVENSQGLGLINGTNRKESA